MILIMDKRKEIAGKVIDLLGEKGGFDGWWGYIDGEIQEDIIEEIANILPESIN